MLVQPRRTSIPTINAKRCRPRYEQITVPDAVSFFVLLIRIVEGCLFVIQVLDTNDRNTAWPPLSLFEPTTINIPSESSDIGLRPTWGKLFAHAANASLSSSSNQIGGASCTA